LTATPPVVLIVVTDKFDPAACATCAQVALSKKTKISLSSERKKY
jgi:hypothetical protein